MAKLPPDIGSLLWKPVHPRPQPRRGRPDTTAFEQALPSTVEKTAAVSSRKPSPWRWGPRTTRGPGAADGGNAHAHRRPRRASAPLRPCKSPASRGAGPSWAPPRRGSHSPRSQRGPPSASAPRPGPAADGLAERGRPAATAACYLRLPSTGTPQCCPRWVSAASGLRPCHSAAGPARRLLRPPPASARCPLSPCFQSNAFT